jgi:hypothetical protein
MGNVSKTALVHFRLEVNRLSSWRRRVALNRKLFIPEAKKPQRA